MPLYWASRHGHFEVVEYLLSLDSKRSSIDGCLMASIEGNEPEIAKLLLEAGASITSETVSTRMLSFRPSGSELISYSGKRQ